MMASIPPGWYPDPDGKPCQRYWDGSMWTLETRPVKIIKPTENITSNGMSTGWKIAIAIAVALSLIILIYSASDPDFWTY